jgi:hypothetical protein
MSSKTLGASFRDPSGFLFTRAGQLYRQGLVHIFTHRVTVGHLLQVRTGRFQTAVFCTGLHENVIDHIGRTTVTVDFYLKMLFQGPNRKNR